MQELCLDDGGTGWPQPGGQKLFKIRLADSFAGHRKSASFLVKRRYAWRGYEAGGGVLGVQPNRITLSACDHDETIATISVGLDSVIGLFVDQFAHRQVASLDHVDVVTGALIDDDIFHVRAFLERFVDSAFQANLFTAAPTAVGGDDNSRAEVENARPTIDARMAVGRSGRTRSAKRPLARNRSASCRTSSAVLTM